LSDEDIRQLCELPETVFDSRRHANAIEIFKTQNHHNTSPMLQHSKDAVAAEKLRLKPTYTYPVTNEHRAEFVPMIENFLDRQVKVAGEAKKISFGLSSFGYDVRLSSQEVDGKPAFVIFTNHKSAFIDPKKADAERNTTPLEVQVDEDGAKYVMMPPNSYGMGYTVEKFNIPRDVSVLCVGKSTYARSAIIVNVTPIEAGFVGTVVIEIGNFANLPAKIYLDEGIAQFVFFRGKRACNTSYADRGGKYMGQVGIVHSKV
jgi:dCTP deaminase